MRFPRRRLVLATVTLAVAALLPAAADPAEEKKDEKESALAKYLKVVKFSKVELDTSRAVRVSNEPFRVEHLDLTLEDGLLYLSKPYEEGDPPIMAFFAGKGRMRFTPPTEVDRYMLNYKIGVEQVEAPFDDAFFIVSPGGAFRHLADRLEPAGGGASGVESRFKARREALGSIPFATPTVLGVPPRAEWGDAYAVNMNVAGHGSVWYVRDPSIPKENVIWKELSLGFGKTYVDFQDGENIWGLMDDKADLEKIARGQMDPGHEQKDRLQMEHVDMDLTIGRGGLLVQETARVTFTPLFDGETFAYFELIWDSEGNHGRTKVLSVKENGQDKTFEHRNNILLVGLDQPTKKGEKRTVEVQAEFDIVRGIQAFGPAPPPDYPPGAPWPPPGADALDQDFQAFSLLNTFAWFPQHGYLQRYSIDWRIATPTPIVAVASGTTARRWEEGGYNHLHTVEKEKVALASILLGRFVSYADDSKRPVINVHSLPRQQKALKGLAQTARNVVDLYEERLGPFPYEELDLGQMSFGFGFGQAPPGLVQVTGETFLSDSEFADFFGGDPTFKWGFLAHEIGHQWFGHVVSWASMEDQWLSESYTEYLSGLYLLALEGFGAPAFETKKREWKQTALLAKDRGPIEAGYARLGGRAAIQLYNKGPYVLHMFHQALIANFDQAEGDRLFFETMRNFMERFRHQNATTRDFQRVIKDTTRLDFDWFFDQWFRGVGLPTIHWSYEIRETEDGKFLIEGVLRQENTGGGPKGLAVPIYLHYGSKVSEPVWRVMATMEGDEFKPVAEYPVKLKVAERPDRVTVDDHKTLLGDVVVR